MIQVNFLGKVAMKLFNLIYISADLFHIAKNFVESQT
jgi:hypothetical protein